MIKLYACIMILGTLACTKSDGYKYPGTGIPHLSRDVEITALNDDIAAYSHSFASVKYALGRIEFQDTDQYNFVSRSGLYGTPLCLKVNLHIEKGLCLITVGDLTYRISPTSIMLDNRGTTVYRHDTTRLETIIIEVFSPTNQTTRLYADGKLLTLVKIDTSRPAKVQISLTNGCSGRIGPWIWLRGYE
jgi:hypothetical protein